MRVLIVGAGGHGQVVADVLQNASRHGADCEPVGYVDDDPALLGRTFLDLRVLGGVDCLASLSHDGVIIAIGDNEIRSSVFQRLQQRGERFVIARHPSAVISPDVKIGAGTLICAGVIVNTGTTIGSNVILNTGCSIDHHNGIADHVHVGPGARTGGAVSVDTGALIGMGANVMPGRTVGARSVVGAAALVHRDVAAGAVVAGVPARPLRTAAWRPARRT